MGRITEIIHTRRLGGALTWRSQKDIDLGMTQKEDFHIPRAPDSLRVLLTRKLLKKDEKQNP
jgi:hypothetical protein